jgi:hypothetical protein
LVQKDQEYNTENEKKIRKFQLGDVVLKAARINNKLGKKWEGPYRIIDVSKEGRNFKLERMNKRGKPIDANIRTLKYYYADTSKRLLQAAKDLEWAKEFVKRKGIVFGKRDNEEDEEIIETQTESKKKEEEEDEFVPWVLD